MIAYLKGSIVKFERNFETVWKTNVRQYDDNKYQVKHGCV